MKKSILPLFLALLLLAGCAGVGAAVTPPASEPPADTAVITSEPEHEPETEPEHEHQPAEEPAVTDEPEMVYCGNTVTTITVDGEEYSFWGDGSVALTDLLLHLDYADDFCRCLPEYTVDTEFGTGYGINLSESYARNAGGQTPLTAEQVELIRGIIERNCV